MRWEDRYAWGKEVEGGQGREGWLEGEVRLRENDKGSLKERQTGGDMGR